MQAFEQNIISAHGEKGRLWRKNMPNLVTQLANTYGLSNLKPVSNLIYNYVLSGFQGPQPIILKLGLDIDGLRREAEALIAFSGFGVVRLLAANDGVLLLVACADPGISLKSYFPEKEDEAMNITAKVIKIAQSAHAKCRCISSHQRLA